MDYSDRMTDDQKAEWKKKISDKLKVCPILILFIYTYVYIHVYIYICVCIDMYIYMCMYIYIYMYTCIYIIGRHILFVRQLWGGYM